MNVLVVDDDTEIRTLVAFTLRGDGHTVSEAGNGQAALDAVARGDVDLVILDVNMPVMNGFEALRRLRERWTMPVMMLTVRAAEEDQVRGLDLGADDYLAKPFSPRALLARVRALGRRAAGSRPGDVDLGDLALDPDTQSVRVQGGTPVRLTALEFRLLQVLGAQPGKPIAPDRLAREVWGYQGLGDRTRLKQLVHRLRQKIEPGEGEARYLVTLSGVGYVLHTAPRPL